MNPIKPISASINFPMQIVVYNAACGGKTEVFPHRDFNVLFV